MNRPSAQPFESKKISPSFSKKDPSWIEVLTRLTPHIKRGEELFEKRIRLTIPEVRRELVSLFAGGGKRVRMALVLLSGEIFGPINDELIDSALSCEILHLASLVHDDILDGSNQRRTRPTLNHTFGAHLGVLVGDLLFAESLKGGIDSQNLAVAKILVELTHTLVEGELYQWKFRRQETITLEDYEQIILRKTAQFFSSACSIGGLTMGAKPTQIKALEEFGLATGFAFQLIDDGLDFHHSGSTGKPSNLDLFNGVMSWPLIYLLQSSHSADKSRLKAFLTREGEKTWGEIQDLLVTYKVVQKLQEKVKSYHQKARNSLEKIGGDLDVSSLQVLLEFLSNRSN